MNYDIACSMNNVLVLLDSSLILQGFLEFDMDVNGNVFYMGVCIKSKAYFCMSKFIESTLKYNISTLKFGKSSCFS